MIKRQGRLKRFVKIPVFTRKLVKGNKSISIDLIFIFGSLPNLSNPLWQIPFKAI